MRQPLAQIGTLQVQMTFEELTEFVVDIVDRAIGTHTERNMKSGIEGIMQIFMCSYSTAVRIKNDGHIDEAITYTGEGDHFIIDADKALKAMKKNCPARVEKLKKKKNQ